MHMEHPSLSRRHAIFIRNKQSSEVFLYDHGSTHGTTLNYHPVKPFTYIEITDGDIIKFGESTRMVIAHLAQDDSSESSDQEVNQKVESENMEAADSHKETVKDSYQSKIQQALLQGSKLAESRKML